MRRNAEKTFTSNKANPNCGNHDVESQAMQPPPYWRVKIPEKYDISKKLPRFESVKRCRKHQQKRIRDLQGGDYSMQELADLLKSCRPYHRCGSQACCFCMRQYRRWYVSQGLKQMMGAEPLYHVTIILEEYAIKEVSEIDRIDQLKSVIMKKIERYLPPNALVCGRVEVSFEYDLAAFLPHFHGLIAGCTKAEIHRLKPKGKKWFSRKTFRPVVCKRVGPGKEMDRLSYGVKQFQPNPWTRHRKKVDISNRSRSLYGATSRGPSIETKRLAILGACKTEHLSIYRGFKRDRTGKRLQTTRSKKK